MLVKRHKVEGDLIRLTRRHAPDVIQRCTGTHVGGHGARASEMQLLAIIGRIKVWMFGYDFLMHIDI